MAHSTANAATPTPPRHITDQPSHCRTCPTLRACLTCPVTTAWCPAWTSAPPLPGMTASPLLSPAQISRSAWGLAGPRSYPPGHEEVVRRPRGSVLRAAWRPVARTTDTPDGALADRGAVASG